jgi:hypothetical protein
MCGSATREALTERLEIEAAQSSLARPVDHFNRITSVPDFHRALARYRTRFDRLVEVDRGTSDRSQSSAGSLRALGHRKARSDLSGKVAPGGNKAAGPRTPSGRKPARQVSGGNAVGRLTSSGPRVAAISCRTARLAGEGPGARHQVIASRARISSTAAARSRAVMSQRVGRGMSSRGATRSVDRPA